MELTWDFANFFAKRNKNKFNDLPPMAKQSNVLDFHNELVYVIHYLLNSGAAIRVGNYSEDKMPIPLFKHTNIGNEAMDSISSKYGKLLLDDGIRLKQPKTMKTLMGWIIKKFPEIKILAEQRYAKKLDKDKHTLQIIAGAAHRIAARNDEKKQFRLLKFIYFAAAFLFVVVGVNAYAKNPNQFYALLQALLLSATAIPPTILLCLGAMQKLKTVFIWYIIKTLLLGCLLVFYLSFFMDNTLHGRLAATLAISPMILLLGFSAIYLMLYALRKGLRRLDRNHRLTYTLMRPFRRYRKNFMRLLELRWFFAAGSFAILSVANLGLLLPNLDAIVK
jgi:hypothetical protein